MPENGKAHDQVEMNARFSPIGTEWILTLVLMGCVILPVAWLTLGWSPNGADATMEFIGAAVYLMFAAIWLPLAWLRLRQREWLWFSSYMLLFATGLCMLAAHLLPSSGPRFQLALLALACAASALTLMILKFIELVRRRLGERPNRIDPAPAEAPEPQATWTWARRHRSRRW